MIAFARSGRVEVWLSGPTVYLDNWALIDLAEKNPLRRERFTRAVHSGIDLLFSVTNAAELSAQQGQSAEILRRFLDGFGPHWFPVPHNVTAVLDREAKGVAPLEAYADKDFFESHVAAQIRNAMRSGTGLLPLSDDIFSLGDIMARVTSERESIRKAKAEFDYLIKSKMNKIRDRSRREPNFLETHFPVVKFNPNQRVGFVYHNLLRILALEPASLKEGDGFDFCHAVIAFAISSFAALDKHWKRRLERLPANRLARIYAAANLDQMVNDMESYLNHRAA